MTPKLLLFCVIKENIIVFHVYFKILKNIELLFCYLIITIENNEFINRVYK